MIPARIRTAVLTALVVSLLVGACGSGQRRAPKPSDHAAARGKAVLAYVRHDEIRLADAAGHTWRLAPLDGRLSVFRWSPDGTRLAWIDNSADDPTQDDSSRLHLARLSDGKVFSLPCPCSGLGFLGNDAATLLGDGTALELLTPDGVPRRLQLDQQQPSFSSLAAGGDDRVTPAAGLDENKTGVRGQSALRTVDARGHVAGIPGAFQTSFSRALASPDGRRVTYVNSPSSGACASRENVAIIDPAHARSITPAVPTGTGFRSAVLAEYRLVSSYGWAGSGVVVTYVPVLGCQVAYPSRLISYYLQGDQWIPLGIGQVAIQLESVLGLV